MYKLIFTVIAIIYSCSNETGTNKQSEPEQEEETSIENLQGVVKPAFGHVSDLNGWHIFLIEQGLGRGQLANISANGSFSFNNIDKTNAYSILLFSNKYQLMSVLSGSNEDGKLWQYFKLNNANLPQLIFSGPSLFFSQETEISPVDTTILDEDANQTPDGVDNIWQLRAEEKTPTTTTLPEFDHDKDGLADQIDTDDDNDGISDAFDDDSNGDEKPDILGRTHDQYFTAGLEFLLLSLERWDNSTTETDFFLNFLLKLKTPATAVKVIGPESVFENAKLININGEETDWDLNLYDNGENYDLNKEDLTYGARLKIPETSLPLKRQAYFIHVETETNSKYYLGEFPQQTISPITATVSNTDVNISGTPMGEQAFTWAYLVYLEDSLIFASKPIPSTTTNATFPSDAFPKTGELQLKVVANSIQRLRGYPQYQVHSTLTPIPQSGTLTLAP